MPLKQIDYQKGLIYKIQHLENEGLLYVGSTTNFIKRKQNHKQRCNTPTNKNYNLQVYKMIRDNGGWLQFKMIIIKEYPCDTKAELLIEEDRMMREVKSNMNRLRAYRTDDEKKEYNKEYREANKDTIKENKIEYREANKDIIKEKQKEYYEANKDIIKDYQKEYYEANKDIIKDYQKEFYELNKDTIKDHRKEYYEVNKDTIKEQRKEKFICECGSSICINHKARHNNSLKHKQYLLINTK